MHIRKRNLQNKWVKKWITNTNKRLILTKQEIKPSQDQPFDTQTFPKKDENNINGFALCV